MKAGVQQTVSAQAEMVEEGQARDLCKEGCLTCVQVTAVEHERREPSEVRDDQRASRMCSEVNSSEIQLLCEGGAESFRKKAESATGRRRLEQSLGQAGVKQKAAQVVRQTDQAVHAVKMPADAQAGEGGERGWRGGRKGGRRGQDCGGGGKVMRWKMTAPIALGEFNNTSRLGKKDPICVLQKDVFKSFLEHT